MFEPFPDNYVWNLSAGIALAAGGLIGEVDRACRPLRDLKTADEDEATHAFFQSWCAVADGLVELAEADEKRHRHRSAGHGRAADIADLANDGAGSLALREGRLGREKKKQSGKGQRPDRPTQRGHGSDCIGERHSFILTILNLAD